MGPRSDSNEQIDSRLSGEMSIKELLREIPGIGRVTCIKLQKAGFETIDDLKTATNQELQEVERVGPSTANEILEFIGSVNFRYEEHHSEQTTDYRMKDETDPLSKLSNEIPVVGRTTRSKLRSAGFDTIEALYEADRHELQEVRGVGPHTAKEISKLIETWVGEVPSETEEYPENGDQVQAEGKTEATVSSREGRKLNNESTDDILEEIKSEFEINDSEHEN
jgi:large subunit ribosomal protein L32e